MNYPHPSRPSNRDLADARALLERLHGSTRRDRSAFTLAYVLAFDHMAPDLTDAALRRHLTRAFALHQICAEGQT